MAMRQARKSLDILCGDTRRVVGRTPQKAVKTTSLPQNIIFWCENSGRPYPLTQNGICDFFKEVNIAVTPENIEWAVNTLLNTPIMDTADLDGNPIGMSCEIDADPGNVSLSQLGINKSMIIRPTNRPPTMIAKTVDDNMMSNIQSTYPPGYGDSQDNFLIDEYGRHVAIGDGVGILLGKPVIQVRNALIKSKSVYSKNTGEWKQ